MGSALPWEVRSASSTGSSVLEHIAVRPRKEKMPVALCLPPRWSHALSGAWIHGSPEPRHCDLLACQGCELVPPDGLAKSVLWLVYFFLFLQAAEGGTCDSGRESWTGFWSANDD